MTNKSIIITHRRDCQEPRHVKKDRSNYHLTSLFNDDIRDARLAQKILITVTPHPTPPWERICCPAPTFWVHNISIDPFPAPPRKICFLPRLKQVYIQGAFFNCFAQISVLKRKTLFNQRGSFVHQEYHGRESLIDCPTFFILVLKIGRNS